MSAFDEAIARVQALGTGTGLTDTIAGLEYRLCSTSRDDACRIVAERGITGDVMAAALLVKALSGQIHVVVHAVGILTALPYVLGEDEVIQSLSLGAGNTGREHDLETDCQIAEFKFIEWRGGAESIRQNTLFVDLFNLANANTSKRRVLYIVGKTMPLRFLSSGRALTSVLSRNAAAADRFRALHGGAFRTVRDYYDSVRHLVEVVDLRDLVPALRDVEE